MASFFDAVIRVCVTGGDAAFAALGFFSPAVVLCILSAVAGVLMLLVWRYTSNQSAIADARRQISAHLLATRLFKDNLAVTFRAQRQILWQAIRLMGLSVRPMLIMLIPFVLVMVQIGLRYEYRPFTPAEKVRVCATLRNSDKMYGVGDRLDLPDGLSADPHDPCRAEALRTVDWRLTPKREGSYRLVFGHGADRVEMPLVIGSGLVRVSRFRGGGFWERLLYSAEPSIPASSVFESIRIEYPPRTTPIFGLELHWLLTFLILSIVFALIVKPILRVHI